MGRAMRLGSHLVTIHLENAGLYGRRLAILGMRIASIIVIMATLVW